jgi:hypothetical protein
MGQILSGLPQVGISGTQPVNLIRLLPLDPMDFALKIKASVRECFQGLLSHNAYNSTSLNHI